MKLVSWELKEKVGVVVDKGAVEISSIWASSVADSLIVISIDCKSKYPALGPVSSNQIHLISNEQDRTAKASTIVTLDLPEGFEIGPIECGRYALTLFCYNRLTRDKSPVVLLWEAE